MAEVVGTPSAALVSVVRAGEAVVHVAERDCVGEARQAYGAAAPAAVV